MSQIEIRHFHLFCGLGGGARGFNLGAARVGQAEARFRCLGGVDSDPASIVDFGRLAGVPGTVMDLFDRDQYVAWHGHEPPEEWREVTPADIRRAAGNERPHIVFTSAPCKGFSGLLSQKRSTSEKYQALNRLTLRGIWLTLEAWADDPPEFILFENVPRITSRGRPLLDQIETLLQQYGYATAETTHDCGELGGLAQSRRRFLLVARHREKVPPFLYEPPQRPLRGVGDVLGKFPLPGDPAAGPMHRVPSLQWRTWVRLAMVEAGGDWRSLDRLKVQDGVLADYGIVPGGGWYSGALGVLDWRNPAGTVTGGAGNVYRGRFAVADPRPAGWAQYGQLGVRGWDESTGAVTSQRSPGQGRFAVADPRIGQNGPRFNNVYRVVAWGQHRPAVTGGGGPTAGGVAVADPRGFAGFGKYRVADWDGQVGTVIAGSTTGQGAYAVADPRTGWVEKRPHYQTGGHYGVVPWDAQAYAVPGQAKHDRGPWSVADPRCNPGTEYSPDYSLPEATDRGVYVIRALDDTWHRPFTTLELAALQSLVDPEEHIELHGTSDSAWRERIGNAVPSDAAEAIAGVMGRTLLLAWSGETFVLDSMPIWVRPIAIGAAVETPRA